MFATYIADLKHTWQVLVTSELKINFFCFFALPNMVWIFAGVENIYLSAMQKFATAQNEPKLAETK